MLETTPNQLSQLPAVDRLLNSPGAQPLIGMHGRSAVTAAIRVVLEACRTRLRTNPAHDAAVDIDSLIADVAAQLDAAAQPSLRPVFNLTGTVLHTNLGRAFLPEEAITAVADVARGASNLEYDLDKGERGDRDSHLEDQICRLTGAEAATVVNNNAAAVMLVLNTLALGREVPVSRGELVEIGGSFRIPDIMARSGCTLVEVGTTNRTHLKDFAAAIGPETAMIMKVHTSNYVISGFTKVVPEGELSELCTKAGIPFVNDLGSGTLVDLEAFGLPHEPTPMDALRHGADIVTFSGDKLLGGPQAGLIVGRRDLVARIKSNPMKRALRCDKMTIAALSAVLRIYAQPERLAESLPVLAALTRPRDAIREQAMRLQPVLAQTFGGMAEVSVVDCVSEIGSGALPTRTIDSAGLAIHPSRQDIGEGTALNQITACLRALPQPVIGRIKDGALILDLRCLADEEAFRSQIADLRPGAPGETGRGV